MGYERFRLGILWFLGVISVYAYIHAYHELKAKIEFGDAGSKPFLFPFGDCIQLSILPVPVRATLTGLFRLLNRVARLIDNVAISSFGFIVHHTSFVSAPLTDPFLFLDLCRPPALWRDFPQTRSLSAVLTILRLVSAFPFQSIVNSNKLAFIEIFVNTFR